MGVAVGEAAPDLAALVATRGLALTRFAYALCGDRQLAEDLVQQALTSVHRRWSDLVPDHPEAYVRQTVVRAFLTSRRRRASTEVVTDVVPAGQPVPDVGDDIGARDAVWRVLAQLPPRQRAVLVLRYYEDLDDRSIARLLGCAEGTVRSDASRAFQRLRADPTMAEEHRP